MCNVLKYCKIFKNGLVRMRFCYFFNLLKISTVHEYILNLVLLQCTYLIRSSSFSIDQNCSSTSFLNAQPINAGVLLKDIDRQSRTRAEGS